MNFSSVIFLIAKSPQLKVLWNKYAKSMEDLNLKQNGPVEIIAFWKGINKHAPDLAIIA